MGFVMSLIMKCAPDTMRRAQAVNQATQSSSLTPELEGNCLSKRRGGLLTVYPEMDGCILLEEQIGTMPVFVWGCIHVYECGTGSLGAADVSEDTDLMQGDDVTPQSQGAFPIIYLVGRCRGEANECR